jgi:pSer/pThr/pTyr-binding forkhead associated (FHA) protein
MQSMATMNRCPACGHNNRSGMLYCEACGANLIDQDGIPTKKLPSRENRRDPNAPITIRVRDNTTPIILERMERIVLGRVEAGTDDEPDLDLTPYGAPEKGVSRIHAVLTENGNALNLIDMGSSNGTFLNGQRLIPNQPLPVNDGDEIRLGRLVTHIFLK